MNIASKANRYEILMRFKRKSVREKLHTLKFIFNCHVKTAALIICFKNLFVQVWAIPEVVSKPAVVAGPLTLEFQHVTVATRSEVRTGKVKYVYASILKRNEIEPLIIISSHDFHFHSNNHSLVAEPGEGPGGSCPPLFLDQTEARRTEKKMGRTSLSLISGSGWLSPPLPYSKLYKDNWKLLFEWNGQEVICEIVLWLPRR